MPAMSAPRELVAEIEASPCVPHGSEERFAGYGVMGLPFSSGHILAMRRFPASSVGPGYSSVWHRDPAGRWTFFQDLPPVNGCARYFSSAVAEVLTVPIQINWEGPRQLSVTVKDVSRRLDWNTRLTSSAVTKVMSALASRLPDAVWKHPAFLASMGLVAGPILGAGKVRFQGQAPNRQRFVANPHMVWLVAESRATLDGVDLGPIGPAPTPGQMADFSIPQRGVFVIGTAFFKPAPADEGTLNGVAIDRRRR